MKWIQYSVELEGITELLGGMPRDPKLIEGMMSSKEVRLRAKTLGRDPERIIAENLKDMGADQTETEVNEDAMEKALDEERMACTFRRTADGILALGAHQIPALLIDCATTLKLSRKVPGLKDTITRGTEVWQAQGQHLLRLSDAAGPAATPHGTLEWGSQIQDRMGRRAILRRYDYLLPWSLAFQVRYVDNGILTKEHWADLWELAAVQGIGAARPRGYGKFRVVKMVRSE